MREPKPVVEVFIAFCIFLSFPVQGLLVHLEGTLHGIERQKLTPDKTRSGFLVSFQNNMCGPKPVGKVFSYLKAGYMIYMFFFFYSTLQSRMASGTRTYLYGVW
jgi:hypothetical protein